MAHGSPNYRMANKLADGQLDAILTRYVEEGLSYSSITARLLADHGIEVSPPTVGKWLASLPNAEARS